MPVLSLHAWLVAAGLEKTPLVKSCEPNGGRVVFQYDPLVGNFVSHFQLRRDQQKSRKYSLSIAMQFLYVYIVSLFPLLISLGFAGTLSV